jgi:valyl-tRNA synthetase
MGEIQDAIHAIRDLKQALGIKTEVTVLIDAKELSFKCWPDTALAFIGVHAKVSIQCTDSASIKKPFISRMAGGISMYMQIPPDNFAYMGAYINKIAAKIAATEKSIHAKQQKLNSPAYITYAPKHVVADTKRLLSVEEKSLAALRKSLDEITYEQLDTTPI